MTIQNSRSMPAPVSNDLLVVVLQTMIMITILIRYDANDYQVLLSWSYCRPYIATSVTPIVSGDKALTACVFTQYYTDCSLQSIAPTRCPHE